MAWVVPTIIYVFLLGALGVTGKLALRTLEWPELILWATVCYVITTAVLLALGQTEFRVVAGTGWAIAAAIAAIGALVALYVALGTGEVSKVVPISAAYPAVTLLLSALFLSEPVSAMRWVGTAVIVTGVVMVSAAR